MDADAIEQGLAAWGVPVFVERPPPGFPKPPLADLIRACLVSERPRYRAAIVSLLLATPTDEVREAVASLRAVLDGEARVWLRWLILAAHYLARIYRTELTALLGRTPCVPGPELRHGLPGVEEDHGEAGLRALSAEIAAARGALVDWAETLEAPVRDLLSVLWLERKADEHAGARRPDAA